jgi:hypothetical protein
LAVRTTTGVIIMLVIVLKEFCHEQKSNSCNKVEQGSYVTIGKEVIQFIDLKKILLQQAYFCNRIFLCLPG